VLTILQGVGPFPVALFPGTHSETLGPAPIRQELPPGTAVEVVERSVVQAIGRGAQAFDVRAAGDVAIDQSRSVIHFGSRNKMGNVTMGDVAGGNIIKTTTTAAAAPQGNQELLALIDHLRADVAGLADAPRGKREDADDELRKAKEAAQEGDRPRLLEKLEGAQKVLLSLGWSITAALKLADAVGTLLQRAMGRGL